MDQFNVIRHKFQVEGCSIRKIARELGLSRNTVAKYCGGEVTPSKPRASQRASPKFELTLAKVEEYVANTEERFTAKQRITVPTLQKELARWDMWPAGRPFSRRGPSISADNRRFSSRSFTGRAMRRKWISSKLLPALTVRIERPGCC